MIVTLSTAAALPLLLWRSTMAKGRAKGTRKKKEKQDGRKKNKKKRDEAAKTRQPGAREGEGLEKRDRSRSEKGFFLSFLAELVRCKSNEDHFLVIV